MKTFADKIYEARTLKHLSQEQLAEAVGVSRKSVSNYELGTCIPHKSTILKIAGALGVSITYLTDDECEDPRAGIEKDPYIEEAHEKYGSAGIRDMQRLLAENTALFAGGELSLEQMDRFYAAVTAAYELCRAEASKKFGKKTDGEK